MSGRDSTHDPRSSSVRAAIGLGANLGDPHRALDAALRRLARLGTVDAVSSRYRTRAWGVRDQPDFVNAVALLTTTRDPQALLAALKVIEVELGRVPSARWGPRAIDLDILLYGDLRLDEPELTIPHARLGERAFVLVPLAELLPTFREARDALGADALAEVVRVDAGERSEPPDSRSERVVDWNETLERVRTAAAFCSRTGVARMKIEDDEITIEIRRSPRPPEPVAIAEAGDGRPGEFAAVEVAPEVRDVVLKAEFVGIVRLSHPAVVEGQRLTGPRDVAYVESLGIRNPIRALVAGTVRSVLVTDGEAVEYGQPLVVITPERPA